MAGNALTAKAEVQGAQGSYLEAPPLNPLQVQN
jgi:hypothetical protein